MATLGAFGTAAVACAQASSSTSPPGKERLWRSSFAGDKASIRHRRGISSTSRSPGVLRIECKESRIGKHPVPVPAGVSMTLQGQSIAVKGPLGELTLTYPREIQTTRNESGSIVVARAIESRRARQMHGLFRTLTSNLVTGVSTGFSKRLQLIGVGYRAAVVGEELTLNLGLSHQVRLRIPNGITAKVEENTRLIISGRDKCAVGDFAAAIRAWRPPEPYKGKGIKYSDEIIRRKEGKVGKRK